MVFAKTALGRYMNPPAKRNQAYCPTDEEQIANCITHSVFILPSIFGAFFLSHLAKTSIQKSVAWLYGSGLFFLFLVSSLFHGVSLLKSYRKIRLLLHLGDRSVIYAFIAASYMPWLLLQDVGDKGIMVAWLIWFAAVAGIFYTFIFHEKYKMIEIILYLIIGICPSFLFYFVEEAKGIKELIIGGAFYVLGVPVFKCDGRIPFAHALWHIFVVCGALCHYYAVVIHLYL
ncbi:monocyte to macrophage differentiation factor 2-like [Xenia sp. Carnegie-2017]|uniref:monocyte to macrophage differentiation factor 2-like n=1 Tax=Xenia sp. Carnegie-2017 TaxID=2897299 RepID=UPI001F0345B1|nr:monocyte to macrophage differentiation factor 2-like [Xenia sp. Carnegie-2017]